MKLVLDTNLKGQDEKMAYDKHKIPDWSSSVKFKITAEN